MYLKFSSEKTYLFKVPRETRSVYLVLVIIQVIFVGHSQQKQYFRTHLSGPLHSIPHIQG